MAYILEAKNLHKTYPGVKAVDGIGFQVAAGSCYGLLGPTGAGQTTTMEILEGITAADAGQILYQGRAADDSFRQSIGIQFQTTSLQDFQTVAEALTMFAELYDTRASLDDLIELCHLQEFIDRDTRKLSGGQRQRLLLAIALVNDPQLVFLDEPTTGLHFHDISQLLEVLHRLRDHGNTVVVIEHNLDVIKTADWVIDLGPEGGSGGGTIVATGTPEQVAKVKKSHTGRFLKPIVG